MAMGYGEDLRVAGRTMQLASAMLQMVWAKEALVPQ